MTSGHVFEKNAERSAVKFVVEILNSFYLARTLAEL